MDRCLDIPEVVERICDEMQPTDALDVALTCRAFLEPGLDTVWREIHSLDPLIGCLPLDLWKDPLGKSLGWGRETRIVELRRTLTRDDLLRYTTYYARRIRVLSFDWRPSRFPSIETLHALEVATDFQPGALSPLLKDFAWYIATRAKGKLGADISELLSPFMFLFIGVTVRCLSTFTYQDDPIMHTASVDLSMKRLAKDLKKLRMNGKTQPHFEPSSWPELETLSLTGQAVALIPQLALLPRLETLEISDAWEKNVASQQPVPHGFTSLRTLGWECRDFAGGKQILRCLSSSTPLQEIKWVAWDDISSQAAQELLYLIEERCRPSSFTRLSLSMRSFSRAEEAIEMDDPDQIDISPLYVFGHMESLILRLSRSVLVNPEVFTKIPIVWPRLRRLVLCPSLSSSHIPSVNHEHIVRLAHDLPSLRDLGLPFDATKIPKGEQTAIHSSSVKLRILRVGSSPICSPARVVAFLRRNFPLLEELDTDSYRRTGEGPLYDLRWLFVLQEWKPSRRAS